MTPTDPLKNLDARAEEYVNRISATTPSVPFYDYTAGARAQHSITRKATIDEVLGMLRNGDIWAGFMGDPIMIDACANWLESELKVDLSKDPRETPL